MAPDQKDFIAHLHDRNPGNTVTAMFHCLGYRAGPELFSMYWCLHSDEDARVQLPWKYLLLSHHLGGVTRKSYLIVASISN